MPSPVGHALAGLIVHGLLSRDEAALEDMGRALVTVGAALLPDVDLLFRFVDGRNHHDCETHSIGFAFGAAVVVALLSRFRSWGSPMILALSAGSGWLSHIVLDYLNVDTSVPIGIMALWPFSQGFYKCPWPIFLDIGRTLDWATVRHDALAAAWEAAVLTPLLFGVLWLRHGKRL